MGPPGTCPDPLTLGVGLTVNGYTHLYGADTTIGDNCTDELAVNATSYFECDVYGVNTAIDYYFQLDPFSDSGWLLMGSDLPTTTTFTVDAATGNVHTEGTLTAVGQIIGTGGLDLEGFDVLDTSGNTTITGTLDVTGATINLGDDCTDELTIEATTDFLCDVYASKGTAHYFWLDPLTDQGWLLMGGDLPGPVTFSVDASTGDTTVGGTLGVTGNATLSADLAVNGCDLTTTCTIFNLLDTVATTVNFAGAATTVDIGAATGTTTVHNNLDVDLDVNVDGGDITTNLPAFNLIDTNATNINFAGAATILIIGADTGTTWVDNNLDVDDDLTVENDTWLGDTTGDLTTVFEDLEVGRDIIITGVAGDITKTGNGTLTISTSAAGDNDIIFAPEGVTELTVHHGSGLVTVNDALNVGGNTAISGTLGVTLATTLSGATQINNTLGVGAFATTLGGTLGVTGLITGQAGITLENFSVADTNGNTLIGGTLGVTGTTNIGAGGLNVAGALNVSTGGASIAGGLTVSSGGATINGVLNMNASNITNVATILMNGDIATAGTRVATGYFTNINVLTGVVLPVGSITTAEILNNTILAGDIANDTLNFTEFSDALSVDAATTINTAAGLSIGGFTMTGALISTPIVFGDGTTNPSVSGGNAFVTANTGATIITTFTGGTAGQMITIVFTDANTTVDELTNIRLSAAFTSTADDTMVLVYDGTNWYEVSRSVN